MGPAGTWSQTVHHCFHKAEFSRCISTAGDEAAAGDIGDAVGGAVTAMSLGQLWESASAETLVPCGLKCMDFALADDYVVATEGLSIDKVASSIFEKETITDDGASYP